MADIVDTIMQEFDKQMDRFVDQVFAESQQNLVDEGKIDTGNLLKTGNINRKFLEKEIVYPAPYAEPVHFGRVAGTMPPVAPLEKWARRKLLIRDPKEARRTAWAIAFAIKERGIQPSPFLQNALDKVELEWKNKKIRVIR